MTKNQTSWSKVAKWYNSHLTKKEDTYQRKLILPNLLRLLEIKKGERILDLACGNGFFSKEFALDGAKIIGVDISKKLIQLAKKNAPEGIDFFATPADELKMLASHSIDKIVFVLAIQNIENVKQVLAELSRVLAPKGSIHIVINHPAFRIPKKSGWGFDEKEKRQFRMIDAYLSESKEKIEMHPGKGGRSFTISFHRPFQYYFKLFRKEGFAVLRMEEWASHKESGKGVRQKEENRIRKEIPLFAYLELKKLI